MASTPTQTLRQAMTSRSTFLLPLLVFLRLKLPNIWTNVQFSAVAAIQSIHSGCQESAAFRKVTGRKF